MNKNKLHQPHDALFKKSMENQIVVTDLLKLYLPKAILSRINLSTLKQQKESFIKKDIGRGDVDCLYQVEITNNKSSNSDNHDSRDNNNVRSDNIANKHNTEIGYVYFLLEQQTKPDRFMSFRLLKYMISIIDVS